MLYREPRFKLINYSTIQGRYKILIIIFRNAVQTVLEIGVKKNANAKTAVLVITYLELAFALDNGLDLCKYIIIKLVIVIRTN